MDEPSPPQTKNSANLPTPPAASATVLPGDTPGSSKPRASATEVEEGRWRAKPFSRGLGSDTVKSSLGSLSSYRLRIEDTSGRNTLGLSSTLRDHSNRDHGISGLDHTSSVEFLSRSDPRSPGSGRTPTGGVSSRGPERRSSLGGGSIEGGAELIALDEEDDLVKEEQVDPEKRLKRQPTKMVSAMVQKFESAQKKLADPNDFYNT